MVYFPIVVWALDDVASRLATMVSFATLRDSSHRETPP